MYFLLVRIRLWANNRAAVETRRWYDVSLMVKTFFLPPILLLPKTAINLSHTLGILSSWECGGIITHPCSYSIAASAKPRGRGYANHECLIHSSWWRHPMKTFSVLLVTCAGNSLVTGEFHAQRTVTRSFDVFFDLLLNTRLSKQWWGWWFETQSRPLWRHRNGPCSIWKQLYWTSEAPFTKMDYI